MVQLRLDFTQSADSDDWYELYCHNCCQHRSDKVKFYREPGLTKMFGWDKRVGYSCGGCGYVCFLSYVTTIYGGNFKSGFIRTLASAGWHPIGYSLYRWYTDFFDGGDIYDIPADKREEFEEEYKREVAESKEINRRIKERYG